MVAVMVVFKGCDGGYSRIIMIMEKEEEEEKQGGLEVKAMK